MTSTMPATPRTKASDSELRDVLAGYALQGLRGFFGLRLDSTVAAQVAYADADAMLQARGATEDAPTVTEAPIVTDAPVVSVTPIVSGAPVVTDIAVATGDSGASG